MTFRRYGIVALSCAAIATAWAGPPAQAQEPLNLLFYGNSFTIEGTTRTVPDIVAKIATAAGQPTPYWRNAARNGQTLQWHLTNNATVITTGIAAGDSWDYVVLQDYSTWPTHIGNLPQHLSSSLALYQRVAAHSPEVVPVMFETWARAPLHAFYTAPVIEFPGGPAQMQQELRDGYRQSTANINAAVGEPLARLAPVGDAWEEAGFAIGLYASDRYHASSLGTTLNALVLYGTIYGDRTTSDIDLSSVLTTMGISASNGAQLTALADRVLAPEPATACLALFSFAAVAAGRRRARR